jgi:hypothetical protein
MNQGKLFLMIALLLMMLAGCQKADTGGAPATATLRPDMGQALATATSRPAATPTPSSAPPTQSVTREHRTATYTATVQAIVEPTQAPTSEPVEGFEEERLCPFREGETSPLTYYRPNPALIQVAQQAPDSMNVGSFENYIPAVSWLDKASFNIFERAAEAGGDDCDGIVWDIYELPEGPVEKLASSTTRTECIPPEPAVEETPQVPGLYTDPENEYLDWKIAPDSQTALVTTLLSYEAYPPQGIKLGDEVSDENVYEQGWLVDLRTKSAAPLFYSTEFFGYQWADDSRHLVGIGSCYGMVGSGLISLDTQTSQVYWINDYDSLSEGGSGPLIAPGSGHLIYQSNGGTVVDLQGRQSASICDEGIFPRSYAWSQDGRYAYFSCSSEGSDILRRYDVQTGQASTLTDPTQVTFKALDLFPSPDGKRLLFTWGTSDFFNEEPCGIWLLDLERLGE